jgi:hypothetical protein
VATFVAALALAFTAAAHATANYKWSHAQEAAVLQGCISNGRGNSNLFCVCTLRWLERRYSWSRLATIYLRRPVYYTGVIAVNASRACIAYD